jgi:UDP-N-acetyl-D-mannosaminuronic acid dehydrogenase
MTIHKPSVLIIGLGEIGYNDAEYMSDRGLNVDGYDINKKALNKAHKSGVIQRRTDTFQGYDYYVICVSTHDPGNMCAPSFDGLFQIAQKLQREGEKDSLIALESTVTKGTSEKMMQILGNKMHLAHVPHRYYAAEKEAHGVRQMRVLGGCRPCCTRKALDFYREILDIPVHVANSVEIAELSKVVENSYRFLEIAFAEELKMLCTAHNLSFEELRVAVNSKWNVKILEARQGINGHCLPKDSHMYLELSREIEATSIIESAEKIDELYRKSLAIRPDIQIIVPIAMPEIITT